MDGHAVYARKLQAVGRRAVLVGYDVYLVHGQLAAHHASALGIYGTWRDEVLLRLDEAVGLGTGMVDLYEGPGPAGVYSLGYLVELLYAVIRVCPDALEALQSGHAVHTGQLSHNGAHAAVRAALVVGEQGVGNMAAVLTGYRESGLMRLHDDPVADGHGANFSGCEKSRILQLTCLSFGFVDVLNVRRQSSLMRPASARPRRMMPRSTASLKSVCRKSGCAMFISL